MRQHVAKLAPAFLVGGCSLIYNPSNIDKPMHDARMIDMGETPIDVEIRADASPRDLELTESFPPTVLEGAGTGGARHAVVVLRGRHFVKDAAANLQVMVTPETTGAVVLDSYEVAGNGDYIALALVVPVTDQCDDGGAVNVDVTVSQNDGLGDTVSKMLDNAFAVRCLDELTAAPASANNLKDLYSVINIPTAVDFDPAVDAAILRSASSITLGAVDVSADGQNGGPGGGGGGAGGTSGLNLGNPGGPGTGPAPGMGGPAAANGGGGGYATAGSPGGNSGAAGGGVTGDIWIATYATNRSSGGGGGGGGITGVTGPGGAGGGGGGTLELTAPGPITVGAITADGGDGVTGTGDGGAGTGGTVLIRTGAALSASTVSVAKGSPGAAGGAASDGRVRVDAADGNYPTNATKGPMFVNVPTRTILQQPTLTLRGTPNDDTSTLRVFDKAGMAVSGGGISSYTPVFSMTTGVATATVMPTLKAGYNKVCVWVAGGAPATEESINCVEIAYLPQ